MKMRHKNVNEIARIANKQLFFEEARQQHITFRTEYPRLVKSFKELQQSFREDGSPENITRRFQVVQGQFDRDNTLGLKFRQAYIANYKLAYPDKSDEKGCIKTIFYKGRRQSKRKFNLATTKSHGYKINITRTNIEADKKWLKRPRTVLLDVTYIKHWSEKVTVLPYYDLIFEKPTNQFISLLLQKTDDYKALSTPEKKRKNEAAANKRKKQREQSPIVNTVS
jgi:hypothetical protein